MDWFNAGDYEIVRQVLQRGVAACLVLGFVSAVKQFPVSWFVYHLPGWFHRGEVVGNHVAQLVVPFFLFASQPVASVAAGIIVLTPLWLVITGTPPD